MTLRTPGTLQTQDISALVPDYSAPVRNCPDISALVPKKENTSALGNTDQATARCTAVLA